MSKKIISYLIGLMLIVLSLYLVIQQEKYNSLLNQITYYEFFISILITLIIFFFTGLQISYLTKTQYNNSLKLEDYFLLPIMMHLWSYIIPFRGGLIFSSIFLNQKYKLKLSQGISIGFYTFFISLILTGIYGLYFSLENHSLVLFVISIFLLTCPLFIFLTNFLLKKFNFRNNLLDRLKIFIENIFNNISSFFNQWRTNFIVFAIIFSSIIAYILWFYYASYALGLKNSFSQIIMVALITRLSVIARIIPGNLGIQELFSGGALELAGGSLADGIIISLFIRLSALIIAISLGILGMFVNRKYLNYQELKYQLSFNK
ncbi:MAG: lysylphosphatidylglycerol synthase domain-containing protein [Candidatus Cloacimonadota bacterium]|nr:lysylphosphatidylglycerol synthase domain-containing protein [Candidatus Cloacimonadota bacterium]